MLGEVLEKCFIFFAKNLEDKKRPCTFAAASEGRGVKNDQNSVRRYAEKIEAGRPNQVRIKQHILYTIRSSFDFCKRRKSSLTQLGRRTIYIAIYIFNVKRNMTKLDLCEPSNEI